MVVGAATFGVAIPDAATFGVVIIGFGAVMVTDSATFEITVTFGAVTRAYA
jgi:hypothetical protein